MAGAGMGQPPGLWRRRCMGQPLVSISTGGRPSSGSLGPPPDCGNVLETRTGSLTGKNFGLRPWRTQMLICRVGRFRRSAFRKKVR